MNSLNTVIKGCLAAILIGMTGWAGVISVAPIVAPQGDFSFVAEIDRGASVSTSSTVLAIAKPAVTYVASAAAAVKSTVVKEVVAEKNISAALDATTTVVIPVVDNFVATSTTTVVATSSISVGSIEECTYQTKQFPNHNRLMLNEIAWMGTKADSSKEWIELKNISEDPLELEGYQLIDKAEQIKVTLPKKLLDPGALYLLERGEEEDQILTADLIYTGALSNSNEGLRLFDRHCFLIDQVDALPKWPAGEATSKKSMERGGGMYWYTFNGVAVDGVFGTPGRVNTAPTSTNIVIQTAVAVIESESPAVPPVVVEEPSTPAEEPVLPVFAVKVLISKLQITGGPGKTTEDFVEFYNPGPGQFNLKGYRLVKRTKTGASDTSIKSWTAEEFIAEGATYRWANTNYPGEANIRTSGSIANDNAIALRLGSADTGEIIDAVGWGVAANALIEGSVYGVNPGEGQFLVRKNNQDTDNNSTDFEIQ